MLNFSSHDTSHKQGSRADASRQKGHSFCPGLEAGRGLSDFCLFLSVSVNYNLKTYRLVTKIPED